MALIVDGRRPLAETPRYRIVKDRHRHAAWARRLTPAPRPEISDVGMPKRVSPGDGRLAGASGWHRCGNDRPPRAKL
jgi:hypothetical protein